MKRGEGRGGEGRGSGGQNTTEQDRTGQDKPGHKEGRWANTSYNGKQDDEAEPQAHRYSDVL
jgi:hypothetical protein